MIIEFKGMRPDVEKATFIADSATLSGDIHGNHGMLFDQRASSNNGTAADMGTIHDRGMHAHNNVVFDSGPMNDGVVSHRHALADGDGQIVIGMKHGVVLHVAVAADGDRGNLRTHGSAKPHGGVLSQVDVAAVPSSLPVRWSRSMP